MLNSKKIGIIGSGNMGEALISGLVSSGSASPENIICSDIAADRLDFIRNAYGVKTTGDNLEVSVRSINILRRLLESGDGATKTAARQALEKIAAGEPTAAARRAKAAIRPKAPLPRLAPRCPRPA